MFVDSSVDVGQSLKMRSFSTTPVGTGVVENVMFEQANVLFVIGGKANNTDIYETFRAIADALREHFVEHGPTPVFVVIGRGGPRLVRGMGAFADTMDALGIPFETTHIERTRLVLME